MSQLYIHVVGLNAAGKTFLSEKLAKDLGFNRINGDDFRLFVYEHVAYFRKEKLGKRSVQNDKLNKFLQDYRLGMISLLLGASQNVVLDGSGATQAWRKSYLDEVAKDFPKVKRVIVYVKISEPELLKRLAERDREIKEEIWQDHYHNFRKALLEPPTSNEADILLAYDQHNYEAIREKIEKLLKT